MEAIVVPILPLPEVPQLKFFPFRRISRSRWRRQTERSAVNGHRICEGPSIGNALYQSSLEKGGDLPITLSAILLKETGQVGSIKGDGAVSAFQSHMGIQNEDKRIIPIPMFEIGGGG